MQSWGRLEMNESDKPLPYILGEVGHDDKHSMKQPPDYKRPLRAMPQPTKEKRHEDIEERAKFSYSIAPERNIHIIPKPR